MDRPPANKTEQTQQYILNYIQERHLVHNDRLPPENDLCRTLNVSRVTVRAALKELEEKGLVYQRRGSGTFVGEHSLPQRAELTYVPYVAPSFSKYFRQMEILSGIEDYLKSRGMYVTFHSTGDQESRSEILLRLAEHGTRNVIVSPGSIGSAREREEFDDLLVRLRQMGCEATLVGHASRTITTDAVFADDLDIGRTAVEHLLRQGYRRPAYWFHDEAVYADGVQDDRCLGYRSALREHGLPDAPELICRILNREGNSDADFDRLAAEALDRVLQTAAPDAFFCCNDASALLLCGLLRVRGYRIPEDIGVVGVDALPMTESHDPPITTFDQPFFDMGRRAAQLCCARMADPQKEYEQIYMRTVLLARASTRPHRPAQADGEQEG